jgi:hypothetical protein
MLDQNWAGNPLVAHVEVRFASLEQQRVGLVSTEEKHDHWPFCALYVAPLKKKAFVRKHKVNPEA